MYNARGEGDGERKKGGSERRLFGGWMLVVKARNEPTNTNFSSFSGSWVTGEGEGARGVKPPLRGAF